MKERPILFSGPMVRAILEGRKTQTRRTITPDPKRIHAKYADCSIETARIFRNDATGRIKCPYGQPGDRLWVRETFWAQHDFTDSEYGEGASLGPCLDLGKDFHPGIQYCATPEHLDPPREGQKVDQYTTCEPGDWWLPPPDDWNGKSDYRSEGTWTFLPWGKGRFSKLPSIHMPRWASRLLLQVTSVRVERVQEISPHDALAEGVEYLYRDDSPPSKEITVSAFRNLWDSINAKRGYSWQSNPWVWVVEFEKVDQ
jgi:hypothetical protein